MKKMPRRARKNEGNAPQGPENEGNAPQGPENEENAPQGPKKRQFAIFIEIQIEKFPNTNRNFSSRNLSNTNTIHFHFPGSGNFYLRDFYLYLKSKYKFLKYK